MKTFLPPLLSALVLLTGSASAQKVIRGLGGDDPDAVRSRDPGAVLVIDGEEVPAEAYAQWLIEEVGPPLVREFAGGWLVEDVARERGLGADEAAITAALEEELAVRIEHAFLGQKEGWLDELRRLGRSEGGHRRQRMTELSPLLHATNLAADGRVVPEAKIERDWQLRHGPRGRAFDLDMLKFQVVVQLEADFGGREDYERARQKARAAGTQRALAARARLEAGEDFADLARQLSDDEASKAGGGRVVPFSQFGWPTAFVDALFELEKGQLSEPLFARGGWWLIHVRDWTDTPLESVRETLTRELIEKGPEQDEIGGAWNAVIEGMQVEILPELYSPMTPVPGESRQVMAMTINGQPIPRALYARWLLHARGEPSWRQFTEEWLVEREARKKGFTVTREELDARVAEYVDMQVAQSYKGDRALWLTYLQRTGRDEESYLRQLRRRQRVVLLVEKLMLDERVVTDEMVEAAYRSTYGATGRRVQARVLLLEIPRPELVEGLSKAQLEVKLNEVKEARRRDAQKLVERMRDGEDFVTLVERESDDPVSRARGGRLEGGFVPAGWSDDVSPIVMALGKGEVSDPLLEGRFWCVFEVTDFEQVSLEDVRDAIRLDLETARPPITDVSAHRNVLLKRSEVDVLSGLYR